MRAPERLNGERMDPVLTKVRQVIEGEGLKLSEAADLIGVTSGSLKRHLSGEYIRSDSLARYRAWLNARRSRGVRATQLPLLGVEDRAESDVDDALAKKVFCHERPGRSKPYFVVDLFSGCGGMSLGFDVLEEGRVFQTVLGLDIDEAAVRVFNDNNTQQSSCRGKIGRRVDLAQFLNEAEVLAYYLDHANESRLGIDLSDRLANLPFLGLREFKQRISALDRTFLAGLARIRASQAYKKAYSSLGVAALGQTSVIGFHESLSLPMTSSGSPELGPLVWSEEQKCEDVATAGRKAEPGSSIGNLVLKELERTWKSESEKLQAKASATGEGQLASSARRVKAFARFLETPEMGEVRRLWQAWRSERDGLRLALFNNRETYLALREIYTADFQVDVLLGGPPCQGFSRIGRGKIRSLRESGVHVQTDSSAGDHRNRLLYKYVLFVGALRPKVFLFENVRHFQAQVKTPDGVFQATEVLAEAIQAISGNELEYRVSSRTVDASQHLIPQSRQRFFMCGVRSDVIPRDCQLDVPKWCLALAWQKEIPLRTALEGLPEPAWVGSDQGSGADLSQTVETGIEPRSPNRAENRLVNWFSQPAPGRLEGRGVGMTDSHIARLPRTDDATLFDLMGPGKRWMDYRCDESETLAELKELLKKLRRGLRGKTHKNRSSDEADLLKGIDADVVERLAKSVDGSLSLRLLLECVEPRPGELRHHLLTESYLGKREGNHGDWLARLSPNVPCKTIMSHMAKDTYAYIHPYRPRTLSVREAARVQTFPDWFSFAELGFVDALRAIGNAVPPLLGHQFARRAAEVLWAAESANETQQNNRTTNVETGQGRLLA